MSIWGRAVSTAKIGLLGVTMLLLSLGLKAQEIIFQYGFETSAPTITAIPAQDILEDTSTAAIGFTIGDADTPLTGLSLSASSNNATLINASGVVFGGSGASRTITLTPQPNANGTATITVVVSDGATPTSTSFVLTVSAVNDPPTFAISNALVIVPTGATGTQTLANFTVSMSVGPPDEQATQTLQGFTVQWLGQNAALISAAPSVAVNGTLSYVLRNLPSDGSACMSLTLRDSGSNTGGNNNTSASQSFQIRRGAVVADCATLFSCATDSDSDRLPNCRERGTLSFVDANDPGTLLGNADTDGDAIRDGDEVLGTTAGLNLPALGVNPLRRNILLEYDWFDDAVDCAAHSHRPNATIDSQTAQVYANAPVSNPDGTMGITLIQDYGQGGVFTGGNVIVDSDGIVDSLGTEFYAHKAANFAANRSGYFHWVLLPHRYGDATNGSSGLAEINGDDLIVSLYCANSNGNVRNTIVHELGHNLGLRHGGNVNCNYKPNYNSVMNYRYQFPGIDTNCNVAGDGVPNYSIGTRLTLNENGLNETLGVCGSPGFDWNMNGTIESNVSFDINSADPGQAAGCGGTLTTLSDFNDWANIFYAGISDADLMERSPEVIECTNAPPH